MKRGKGIGMQIRDAWYVLKASSLRTLEKMVVYNFLPSKMSFVVERYCQMNS